MISELLQLDEVPPLHIGVAHSYQGRGCLGMDRQNRELAQHLSRRLGVSVAKDGENRTRNDSVVLALVDTYQISTAKATNLPNVLQRGNDLPAILAGLRSESVDGLLEGYEWNGYRLEGNHVVPLQDIAAS